MALVLLGPPDPYNRKRAEESEHCLHWNRDTVIEWRANAAGNPETPGETEFDAMRAAFETWNEALRECASVRFQEGPRTASRHIGWLSSASELDKNANVIVFRQRLCSDVAPASAACWDDGDCGNAYDCWPHSAFTVALTHAWHRPGGVVLDADIELNVPSFIFSTVDAPPCVSPRFDVTCVAWDLQNTMTHEIGHVLGLDHTKLPGSTMFESAPPGETSKRVLDPGTKSFVCDVYPTGQASTDCVIDAFAPKLGDAARGCACGAGPGPLVLLGALVLLRRRPAWPC